MTQLDQFKLSFNEQFPAFVRQVFDERPFILDFNDTRTVAIIGEGRRVETVVNAARGNGLDGEPRNFDPLLDPVGRFFKTVSYPIFEDSFRVFRGFNGLEEVSVSDYLLDPVAGYFILFTPLQSGEKLRVQYISRADVNFPRTFLVENEQDLYEIYGAPSVNNTLSAGAQLVFANGAPRVIVVQGDHTGIDSSWFNAFAALENQQAYLVVPMQNGNYAEVATVGAEHVAKMSETPYRKERILLIGELPENSETDPENLNSIPRSAIENFDREERVIFIGADNPFTILGGETVESYGGFLAAAVAGRWTSYSYVPTTLYKKNLNRIQLRWDNEEIYSERQLSEIANNGVTLLLKQQGTIQIGRFVTTLNSDNVVEVEPSLWRIRDFVAIEVRLRLEEQFVGRVIVGNIKSFIEEATADILKSLEAQKVIVSHRNVRVNIDEIEPRQVNVSFDIVPVFPLNDIVIRITAVSSF